MTRLQHWQIPGENTTLPSERLVNHFPQLTEQLGDREIYLVRADVNPEGTFKGRGARYGSAHRIRNGAKQLSTVSAGNHARGMMVAARDFEVPLHVTVPETAPPEKSDGLIAFWQSLGGVSRDFTLSKQGWTFDEALESADVDDPGFVHPYDDPVLIEGQGKLLTDIRLTLPSVTDTFSATGGGGLISGMQALNYRYGSTITLHAVEAPGSNSLSNTLRSGSIEPIHASNPNSRFGGVAVEKVGKFCVETLWQNLYDHRNIITASNDGVEALAKMYEEDPVKLPLEPTALLAVDGLMRALEQNKLANDAVVAVVATGHNESYKRLLPVVKQGSPVLGSYTGRERAVHTVKIER